jgi:hypothetical protein
MNAQVVNCTRFWVPRGQTLNLESDGFLVDPESVFGKRQTSCPSSFQTLATSPVLVLLGEPGIGKSTTLEHERDLMKPSIEAGGGAVFHVDLSAYGTDSLLHTCVFKSAEFEAWKSGSHRLHLFLDSLDECLLHVRTVGGLLTDVCSSAPRERLLLRIVCRTGDWPADLEADLRRLWGESKVEVYELAPLRRCDARQIAEAHGVPPDQFLKEVDRLSVAAFANKPLTLKSLLDSFQRDQALPSGKIDLYRKECQILCDEWRERRRKAQGLLTEARFHIACGLAATLIFCGRTAIWTAPLHTQPPDGDVRDDDLVGREVTLEGELPRHIGRTDIDETLATGLFRSRGEHRLGFSHQTYAEYLAAQYLVTRRLPTPAILKLILHKDGSGTVVPQLRETAAWLAGMLPAVFRTLVKQNADVLLSIDCVDAAPQDQADLLRHVLQSPDDETRFYERMMRLSGFQLKYEGLASDLKSYIRDTQRSVTARRLAITIAELSKQVSLQADLVTIALDEKEPHDVRVMAAFVLSRFGLESAKAELKRLAIDKSLGGIAQGYSSGDAAVLALEAGADALVMPPDPEAAVKAVLAAVQDPDDELKGCALLATWPKHLTARELFSALTPPKMSNFTGTYQIFLRGDIASNLHERDALSALDWARAYNTFFARGELMSEVAENVIARIIDFYAEAGVAELVADILVARAKEYFHRNVPFRDKLQANQPARRTIASAALSSALDASSVLVLLDSELIAAEDITFLLDKLGTCKSPDAERGLAFLIARLLQWADPESFDRVLIAAQNNDLLRQTLKPLLDPVELRSADAEYKKAECEMRGTPQTQQAQLDPGIEAEPSPRLASPPQLDDLLAAYESGTERIFTYIYHRLRGGSVDPPTELLPGWEDLELNVQRRVLDTAESYLQTLTDRSWVPSEFSRMAGYWALRLLNREAPQALASLSAKVWQDWMPSAFGAVLADSSDYQADSLILKAAYQHASQEFMDVADYLIDCQNDNYHDVFMLDRFLPVWCNETAELLRSKLSNTGLKPKVFEKVLALLIKSSDKGTVQFAIELVRGATTPSQNDMIRPVIAACQLLYEDAASYWDCVWSAVHANSDFAGKVFDALAINPYGLTGELIQRLPECRLAEMYLWLAHHATRSVLFKHQVIAHLANRGTSEALKQIRRIQEALPGEPLQFVLESAEELVRRNTWRPLSVPELFGLMSAGGRKKAVEVGPGAPETEGKPDKGNMDLLRSGGKLKRAVTLDVARRFGGVSRRAIEDAAKKNKGLKTEGKRLQRRVLVASLLEYFPPEK